MKLNLQEKLKFKILIPLRICCTICEKFTVIKFSNITTAL